MCFSYTISWLRKTLPWQNSFEEQLGANLINPRNTCLPNNKNRNLQQAMIAFSPKVNEIIDAYLLIFYRLRFSDMDNGPETSRLASSVSENNSSHLHDSVPQQDQIYVFSPVDVTAKWLLCAHFSTIGCLGFVGNCLLLYFLWKKPKRNAIQRSRFVRNFNLYVRSMSLSDILSCTVSLPLICIQILFDVFQSGWACKLVRYLNFIFPAITINNLVVISLEKYLSTRANPSTLQ